MKTAIFYFSGSGNTRACAKQVSKELENLGHEVDLFPVEDFTKENKSADVFGYELFGFGHPVHAWDAPKIFYRFIRKHLPKNKKAKAFTFRVHGGGPGGTLRPRRHLARKGYRVFYETDFKTPPNMAQATDETQLLSLGKSVFLKCRAVAEEITQNQKKIQRNFGGNLASYTIAQMEKFGLRFFSKNFIVGENCTSCGMCARDCPVGNIQMKDGKPVFVTRDCELCFRCICLCPTSAIDPPFPFTETKIPGKWPHFENYIR